MNSLRSGIEKPSVSKVVLDSSAVLALIAGEPGSQVVSDALDGAVISAVNVAEVVSKLIERQAPDRDATGAVRTLQLSVIPFDAEQAEAAGILRRPTRHLGLSLGDRACLQLALKLGREVLTADRSWAALDVGVHVRLIR